MVPLAQSSSWVLNFLCWLGRLGCCKADRRKSCLSRQALLKGLAFITSET